MKKKLIRAAAAFLAAFSMAAALPVLPDAGITASALTWEDALKIPDDFEIASSEGGGYGYLGYTGKGGNITFPQNSEINIVFNEAVKGNTNITSVTFPEGVDWYIGSEAFSGCTKLKKVIFEGDVRYIGEYAFAGCPNLEEVVFKGNLGNKYDRYPNGTDLGAFALNPKLKKVTFENKKAYISNIWHNTFIGCTGLTSVTLPNDIGYIGNGAFANCLSLKSITLPKSIGEIDDYAFGYMYDVSTKETFVADGKTKATIQYLKSDGTIATAKKAQPAITLTVTKGSTAEKWAKANGIKYEYPGSKKTTSSSEKLAAPSGFKASKSTDKITLKWTAVEGADAYKVYKYNPSTKKYEQYKTVKGTQCTVSGLSSKTQYKFKVTALDSVNGKYVSGETSKAVSVTTK